MKPFPIRPASDIKGVEHLGTLDLWHKYAPPKDSQGQWKSGRSAMEMAKAWRSGLVPQEVAAALAGTPFGRMSIEEGRVELKSKFDRRPGPRNHDLVLFGNVEGLGAVVDIEGKADEGFGSESVGQVLARGTPGQRARARELLGAMMGSSVDLAVAERLPYQLLYGPYATAKLAQARRCTYALFLVQVFANETCRLGKVSEGRAALKSLCRLLDADGREPTRSSPLIGPVKLKGGATWMDRDLEFWLGRVETWQGRMKK